METKRRIVTGFIVIDVLVVIVLVVLWVMKINRTAVLDIVLAPGMATVNINGEKYLPGAYRVYPGQVTAEISAEGFETKTLELNLNAESTTKIYEYLMPTEDNLNYYATHNDDVELLARIGGEEAEEILKVISIKQILPIVDFHYEGLNGKSREIVISEAPECDKIFCLVARGDISNHTEVKNLIKEKGYNPEDYEIVYEAR